MPKWIRPLGAAAGLALIATAAAAQDGPSFDCARAESSAEELVCSDPALAALGVTIGVGVLYSLLLAPISLVLFATTIRREDER